MASLLVEIMFAERHQRDYLLHDFVVMPNHLHVLLTVSTTISRAVQLIKGRFAHDAREQFDIRVQIWQRGFSEHAIRDVRDYFVHRQYIWQNPVRSGEVVVPEEFPYSSACGKFTIDPPPLAAAAKAARLL